MSWPLRTIVMGQKGSFGGHRPPLPQRQSCAPYEWPRMKTNALSSAATKSNIERPTIESATPPVSRVWASIFDVRRLVFDVSVMCRKELGPNLSTPVLSRAVEELWLFR